MEGPDGAREGGGEMAAKRLRSVYGASRSAITDCVRSDIRTRELFWADPWAWARRMRRLAEIQEWLLGPGRVAADEVSVRIG
jgi:hypothetical protein